MQNPMGPHPPSGAPGSPPPAPGSVFGRTPSTTVVVNLSRERLNRGGARPIFPSASALPALQNMQRMQQQGMMGMGPQPNLGSMQQTSLLQQTGGLGQQASLGAMLPGMQGSMGGLQGFQGLQQGMTGMQPSVPSFMGQATIGAPPGNMSIGVNLGMGMPQQQQPQFGNLLGQQQANSNLLGGQRSSLLGGQQSGLLGQPSNLLATLQAQQQNRMLGQQGSGQLLGMGQLGGANQMGMGMNSLTGSVSSNPQMGLLSANLMTSSPQLGQQRSQCTLNAIMPASSQASKPMLQAMETLQGGSPGIQGISGPPALSGTPAPIVMSQPITSAGLAPQMQHLLLKGLPGYTSTLVLILVPQE
ncbi:hypothetical protein HPB52_021824 [Rhipicephalus sanguineus]|uniref:Uncharacterized protein n=2 Tax=Rhipicephalus sanguineus TaxID=34632 RepID=A0A9D4SNB1_RHISA|nr:hypothetical protein HPB52_021824 [Rhipicephalus sanguineus]